MGLRLVAPVVCRECVLVVTQDRCIHDALVEVVDGMELDPVAAGSIADGIAHLAAREFAVAVLDAGRRHRDPTDALLWIKARCPYTEVVLVGDPASVAAATDWMKRGAFDVLNKPVEAKSAAWMVRRALERHRWNLTSRPPCESGIRLLPTPSDRSHREPSALTRAAKARKLWGLSAIEASILMAIACGGSLSDAAAVLGCPKPILELHVTSLLCKSGHADLVSLAEEFWDVR